jgi:hypothetical protein
MNIIISFLMAFLISLLFFPVYRKRGSVAPLIIFFVVLFLAGIAGQYWISPYGPSWRGISWMPVLFLILIFTFLFVTPSPYGHPSENSEREMKKAASVVASVSVFLWILVCILLIAVWAGGMKTPVP